MTMMTMMTMVTMMTMKKMTMMTHFSYGVAVVLNALHDCPPDCARYLGIIVMMTMMIMRPYNDADDDDKENASWSHLP